MIESEMLPMRVSNPTIDRSKPKKNDTTTVLKKAAVAIAFAAAIFLFQAEDGIGDWSVTGVQTWALPICTYAFNPTTGVWSYTLNQTLADPLTAGQTALDHLIVTSADGTATHDIAVTITGSNDNATIDRKSVV